MSKGTGGLPFEWSFHFFTYATAFWAFFTLASTGEIHVVAIVAFMVAFAISLFRRRIGFRLPIWIWNGVSIVAFLVASYGWFALGQRMYAVTYFLLYLEAYKLLTAARPRDYLQIYGLSFFHMLAASVSTTSLFFAPMLALYLLLVMAALITFTIRRDSERAFGADNATEEMGEHWPLPHRLRESDAAVLDRVRRSPYLDRRFLVTLPVLTAAVLCLGIAIFWMVPRMTQQNFFPGLGGASDGPRTSGFADQIAFGIVGEIQRDPTIVMRATFAPGDLDKRGQYLRIRGTALDVFTGENWIQAADTIRQGYQEENRRARVNPLPLSAFAESETIRVRMTVEPEKSGYLFMPDQPILIEFDNQYIFEVNRTTMAAKTRASRYHPVSYTVLAAVQSPIERLTEDSPTNFARGGVASAADLLRESGQHLGFVKQSLEQLGLELLFGGEGPRAGDINLMLPEDSVDIPVIRETAAAWAAELNDPLAIANEIERRFKTEFDYSLEVPFSTQRDHISQFLQTERRGHCEYFATSMVLMLRSLGIPARIVNGYLTDEWSETAGGRFLVRQEHAHSWVEAQVDRSGRWMTFDPTPSSGVGSNRIRSGLYHWYSDLYDVLKMAWYDTVIDFDHNSQRASFISALRFTERTLNRLMRAANRATIWIGEGGGGSFSPRKVLGWGLIGFSFVGAGLLIFGLGRGTRLQQKKKHAAQDAPIRRPDLRPYVELLEALEKRWPRRPSQTPLVYATSLDTTLPLDVQEFVSLTRRYYDVRYNGGEWTPDLTSKARELHNALQHHTTTGTRKSRS